MFLAAVAFITQTHQTLGVFLNQMQYESCGLSPAVIGFVYIAVISAGTSAVFGALAKAALELSFFFGAVLCAAGLLLFFLWYRGTPQADAV